MGKNILSKLNNILCHLTERNKIILFSLLFILFGFLLVPSTSALDYQDNVNMQFTFNPTLSLSLSGDLRIEGLTPGSSSDSNVIDIAVSTNNVTGYTLTASVGNESNPTTSLIYTNSNSNNHQFTSINTPITNLSDFSPNTWGYSYSVDDGTNWISGNIDAYSNGYNGLPLHNDASNPGTILNYKNSASSDNVKFKIGALASSTQASGTYANTINFTAITNPETHYYIQDFTLSECQNLATNDHFTVYDKRDENDYTVRYINGQCWMTQNLRTTGTVYADNSNFANGSFNISAYSLDANDSSYTDRCDSTNGYNYACFKDSGSIETGVWYNYYAATAGTISGVHNPTPATQDICPSGWHLPTGPNTVEGTDLNKLVGNTTSGWQGATSGLATFNAIAGGIYYNGSITYTNIGHWWSSTTSGSQLRYLLLYATGNIFAGDGPYSKIDGCNIRCVTE